ncbi:hypothetical protein [Burkholderia stagnalis]
MSDAFICCGLNARFRDPIASHAPADSAIQHAWQQRRAIALFASSRDQDKNCLHDSPCKQMPINKLLFFF